MYVYFYYYISKINSLLETTYFKGVFWWGGSMDVGKLEVFYLVGEADFFQNWKEEGGPFS